MGLQATGAVEFGQNAHHAAGTVYAVPGEVSDADAGLLIRLGKAEAVETPAAPERRKTKEAKRDVL